MFPAIGHLPVRSVTLSSAGLAQIERAGEVAPDASVTFRAPTDDVDDLLRSLIVVDTAGTVEGVRLPARDLTGEALARADFAGLPVGFDLEPARIGKSFEDGVGNVARHDCAVEIHEHMTVDT